MKSILCLAILLFVSVTAQYGGGVPPTTTTTTTKAYVAETTTTAATTTAATTAAETKAAYVEATTTTAAATTTTAAATTTTAAATTTTAAATTTTAAATTTVDATTSIAATDASTKATTSGTTSATTPTKKPKYTKCQTDAADKCFKKCKVSCNNGVGNGPDCRPGRARFNNDDLLTTAPGAPGSKKHGEIGSEYVTSNKGDNSVVNADLVFIGSDDLPGTVRRTICQDECEDETVPLCSHSECEVSVARKCHKTCKAHCNNGVGNGPDCRPGRARFSNDDHGGVPGVPGSRGGGAAGTAYVTSNKGDNSIVNENLVFEGDVEGTFRRTQCHDECETIGFADCNPTEPPKTTTKKETTKKETTTKQTATTVPAGATTTTHKATGVSTSVPATTTTSVGQTTAATTTVPGATTTGGATTVLPTTLAATTVPPPPPVCGARGKENGGSCRDVIELRQTVMDLTCQVQAILNSVTGYKKN